MDVQKLINELAEKEITLWCEGANLKYTTEKECKGKLTISSKGFVSCRHRNIDPV